MKLLVLSDSHGRRDAVRRVLDLHADADALIFLGDGLRDLPDALPMPLHAVRGNCDSAIFDLPSAPDEQTLCLGGRRIAALHGHTRAAKAGFGRLLALGVEQNADIVCFGHTHAPHEQYIPAGETFFGQPLARPLYLFNPGALLDGRFGLIELRPGGILLSHGQL
ncbi:MAG: metallophosphoesterase [Clostridia bacterium]|nr:metallophosphoesterase [Clostridia bacterium]